MSTLGELLVFAHVVAAAVVVGGGAVLLGLQVRTLAAGDETLGRERAAAYMGTARWSTRALILPAAVVLLLAGAGAVEEIGFDFGDLWLIIGTSVWMVLALVIGPLHALFARALRSALEVDWPSARRVLRRDTVLSSIELALLIGVVWAMVAKPV